MENVEEVEVLVTELIGTEENDYRKAGKFCDFTLKFYNTEDSIEVHKVILASKCPYFKALFESEMIECVNGYLEFKEMITHSELENIIAYLYTGLFKIKTSEAKIYYRHALYFRLENLTSFCKTILIKSIKIDNCLDLWRFGATFCNELELAAFDYILQNSSELFASESFLNLTEKEIIDLISNDKVTCSEDNIYSFVMKWLNFDFDNRNHILNDLIKELRFSLVGTKFLTSEILINNILLDNKNFLTISKEILKSKLDFTEMSCLKFNKMNSPRIGFRQKTAVALLDYDLFKFNDDGSPIKVANLNCYSAQLTPLFKNYLLISQNKVCHYYCPAKKVLYKFPEMKISRTEYGIITLNSKIYCCGGTDDGNVETFDLNAGIWMEGTKMHCKRHNFGITTWENCIYVMGGQHNEDIVERYDPREDQWTILPSISGNSNKSFMRSFTYNEKIYSFTLSEGFIFDFKANKWMDEQIKSPYTTWAKFDLTEIDGIVYMAGYYKDQRSNSYYNLRKYNINSNTWLANTSINSFSYPSMATIML